MVSNHNNNIFSKCFSFKKIIKLMFFLKENLKTTWTTIPNSQWFDFFYKKFDVF